MSGGIDEPGQNIKLDYCEGHINPRWPECLGCTYDANNMRCPGYSRAEIWVHSKKRLDRPPIIEDPANNGFSDKPYFAIETPYDTNQGRVMLVHCNTPEQRKKMLDEGLKTFVTVVGR